MLLSAFPTNLSQFTQARRQPDRPPEFRGPGFGAQFDEDTLFFDAFHDSEGARVALLGPPLLNLGPALAQAKITAGDASPRNVRIRNLDRHAQLWVDAPGKPERLELSSEFGSVSIPVGTNHSEVFAGRRVLFTLSRNNPLTWIKDWVRFNRDVHGADAILFYDNASTLYEPEALDEAIAGIDGIKHSVVVPWPFKYGPQGLDATRFWDSDYCQLGAWEHARWRFLAKAASAMNSDIDELVLTKDKAGVFADAERSLLGIVSYHGRWVVDIAEANAAGLEPMLRRHRDFGVTLRSKIGAGRFFLPIDVNRCRPKWTVVPSRCPPDTQWSVHTIKGWAASHLARRDMSFRHFRPISTSWKYDRGDGTAFDPKLHERDDWLAAAMAKVDWDR